MIEYFSYTKTAENTVNVYDSLHKKLNVVTCETGAGLRQVSIALINKYQNIRVININELYKNHKKEIIIYYETINGNTK